MSGLGLDQISAYFKAVANGIKFQLSAAIAFGAALILLWLPEANELKIVVTVLFLFPINMFVFSMIEKLFQFFKRKVQRHRGWNNLTPEEGAFITYYITNNTKTQYLPCFNGTYRDSGIVNPLIEKEILYLASGMSEFRGDDWMSKEQRFPINISDDALSYFKNKFKNRQP